MRHKSIFINLLLKIVLIWPGFVESWFFKKLMMVFPKFLSGRIDFDKIIAKEENYRLSLEKGIEKYLEIVEQEPVRILDLATGTGAVALYLAQKFSESDVIGVDLAEEMLAAPFSFNEVKSVLKENKYFLISISFGGRFFKKEKNKIKNKLVGYGYELTAVESFDNSGSYLLLKNINN